MSDLLSIWTVYDKPRDFPTMFVARRFEITGAPDPQATSDIIVASELAPIRDMLMRRGLIALQRSKSDEPHIVECWL